MKKLFEQFTIVPSIRMLKDLDYVLESSLPVVLLSEVHIGNLKSLVQRCHNKNKKVLVNVDLIGGFSPDKIGVKLLVDLFKVDGIFTSNIITINMCKSVGLFTIQRFFLMDSKAVDSSLKSLKKSQADAIELLPSPLVPEFFNKIVKKKDIPILAGGFVNDVNSVKEFKKLGLKGMTTSCKDIWKLK
ncbi:glycerol-3-phosphate responsive antiterminator [Clostridiisalibacter paucivorans]|uniref:glycerol-3-phosphate responsive antiterminator n=1 Tax=Clostridiisalibacter paucivorans TaxID=408753 RepID=UPI00047A6AE2|nr:glycerol-3-phosphate responsive antiterminator [Clostridiisalibacter paucivorans]